MEVVLKKTKITKSILDQSLFCHIANIPNLTPLGWVMKKTINGYKKRILLYNVLTEQLFLTAEFSSIKIEKSNDYSLGDKSYYLARYAPSMITQVSSCMLEEDAKILQRKIEATIGEANRLGQIYY